jgi:hypothetical protein
MALVVIHTATSPDSESPNQRDNCCCSLQRYDAISDASQLLRAMFVHHDGSPINQQPNAGFNRRGEVWALGDDVCPRIDIRGGGKQWDTKFASWSVWLRASRSMCSALFWPFASRAAGVGHVLASRARQALPAFIDGCCPLPRSVTSWACGVVHCDAACRMFGPIFPLLYVAVLQSGVGHCAALIVR